MTKSLVDMALGRRSPSPVKLRPPSAIKPLSSTFNEETILDKEQKSRETQGPPIVPPSSQASPNEQEQEQEQEHEHDQRQEKDPQQTKLQDHKNVLFSLEEEKQ